MAEKVPGWPGTGLSGKEMTAVPHTTWEPRLQYAWAAGEAMSKFLDALRQGRFVGTRCKRCERLLFPPRMFCEECYGPAEGWFPVRDTGSIDTFSVSYLDMDANRIEKPIFVGVVVLDEPDRRAPERGRNRLGLMHYFGDIPKDAKAPYGYGIRVGLRVKAVWKPEAERTGSILDVRHFRPMKPGEDPFPARKTKGGES